MTKTNPKTLYQLKIDDDDFKQIIRAFIVASNYLVSMTPQKPNTKKGPRDTKDFRTKNMKIAMELTKAMNNILFKYPHESLKNDK